MDGIGKFLDIYRKRLFKEEDKRKEILIAIEQCTGILIHEKDISVTHGVVSVKKGPVVKNELFLHKKGILEILHQQGRTDIVDIQ